MYVQNNSGDHAYFTMLPNLIIDSSNAHELMTYIFLKRLSGENQKPVWISKRFLMKKMSIGYLKVQEALNNLEKLGAIVHVKDDKVLIKGIEQTVSFYSVTNIWSKNIEHFRFKNETSVQSLFGDSVPVQERGVLVQDRGCSRTRTQGVLPQDTTKNYSNKEQLKVLGERFSLFWNIYPKKKGKGTAERAWFKIAPDEILAQKIISAVEANKKTRQWKENNGKYIPFPATFLNGKRWEDEVDVDDSVDEDTGVLSFNSKK